MELNRKEIDEVLLSMNLEDLKKLEAYYGTPAFRSRTIVKIETPAEIRTEFARRLELLMRK